MLLYIVKRDNDKRLGVSILDALNLMTPNENTTNRNVAGNN